MTIAEKLTRAKIDIDAVYEAGKASGGDSYYDTFWDIYQNDGMRTEYWGGFAGWQDEIFKPKYTPLKANKCAYMFKDSTIKQIPKMIVSAIMDNIFADARSLETIDELELSETMYSAIGAFSNCSALKDIKFSGSKTIYCNISFSASPNLTADSLENVITYLSTTATGKTITFPTTAQSNYDAKYGEGAWDTLIAPITNWTFAYA